MSEQKQEQSKPILFAPAGNTLAGAGGKKTDFIDLEDIFACKFSPFICSN